MHWFYGLLLMGIIIYFIVKRLPEPPNEKENSKTKENNTSKNAKKKKNKKAKAKAQAAQKEKMNAKIQKKNTPPKGKTNELDENEWPSLEKINEEKKAVALAKSKKQHEKQKEQKERQIKKNNEFNITHYNNNDDSSSNLDNESDEYVRKSSDKPVVIQNVSLPITNRKYKKHIVQENQKYISSDDEEISDTEVKVLRVVEKKEDVEAVELPPEVDGWKNVVPKKANVLVIKSSSNPTPVVQKTYIRKPKEEPLTKKQKENRKKAEKKKLEKQRERELQEERLRLHRLEQKRLNIGYKYVPPPKPQQSITVKAKPKAAAIQTHAALPHTSTTVKATSNTKKQNKENNVITAKLPADGITSLWGF